LARYAFIGGSHRGYKLIEALISNGYLPVFSIVLKEDGHEEIKCSDKISELLKQNNIPYSVKKKLTEEDYEMIKKSGLDFVLIFGWRTLADTSVNEYLKLGMIAAHHSLLPLYRGFAPMHWAMINGESETGVTLFLINDGEVDSGKIIRQKKIPILFEDYAWDLYEKLTQCTIEICLDFFKVYDTGKITLTEQDESKVTYCCKRTPGDGRINWSMNSADVYNFIRALAYPFTGAFCEYDEIVFHIRRAKLGVNNSKKFTGCIPGRVISTSKEGIEVLCRKGTILITEWENKKTGIVSCPSENVKSINSTLL
jgi:methionyl-tRNA formyltransferase